MLILHTAIEAAFLNISRNTNSIVYLPPLLLISTYSLDTDEAPCRTIGKLEVFLFLPKCQRKFRLDLFEFESSMACSYCYCKGVNSSTANKFFNFRFAYVASSALTLTSSSIPANLPSSPSTTTPRS